MPEKPMNETDAVRGDMETRVTLLKQAETLTERLAEALKAGDEALAAKLLELRRVMFEKVDRINAKLEETESQSALKSPPVRAEASESIDELRAEARAVVSRILESDKASIELIRLEQTRIASELHRLHQGLKARKAYYGERAFDPRFLDKLK